MITREEVVSLISELVRIESTNPWLVAEGTGEKNVQEFIGRYLDKLGVPNKLEQIDEDCYNLVATLKGSGGGKNITLYAHTDTVGHALWSDRALIPRQEGDRLFGLGAADDKGFCAVIMLAVKDLVDRNIHLTGDINLCFVSDEEGTSKGAMDYVKRHEPEAALILESAPAEHICVTHQGFGWLKITTKGRAGHGSSGACSVDAIYHMAEVIIRLQRNQREKFARSIHPLNGETVYHTGFIKGGTDYASYPEECILGIEIGTQPGENIGDRIKEINEIFEEVKNICPGFDGQVEAVIARDPFIASGHEELYATVSSIVEKYHGQPAKAAGENAWGDGQLFQDAGFPTLGLGSPGGNLHAPDEWVSISGIETLIKVVTDVVEEYCRQRM